jgi:DNA-binding response OmpR family regulator
MKPLDQLEVLVVDDQKSMRELAMIYLFKLGFRRIHEADGGGTACAAIAPKAFDLIVLDWNLGDASGLDVLKRIRTCPLNKATPVLIATGENKLSNVQSAISAGANNYITKPFDETDLKGRLERVLMCKLPVAA